MMKCASPPVAWGRVAQTLVEGGNDCGTFEEPWKLIGRKHRVLEAI